MSSWVNDAAAVQSHNGAAFPHLSDPNAGASMLDSSAFMANPNAFDPVPFQNPQLQQRMQNGGMRISSPAFSNPVYQTSSVVPSKRPRPREDSLGTSPRQAPGLLPNSRSQTPQQGPYPAFPALGQPQQQHGSQTTTTPYAHLHHNGSANASPSPIMANQLRPGAVPQRVSTTSPHPFSPAAQQFATQASPSQSDNGGRVDAPQNPYMQPASFGQNYGQAFTPTPGRTSVPPQGTMPNPQMQQPPLYQQQPQQPQQRPNNLEHPKMAYQMRLQQQLQQGNLMAAQQRMQGMSQNQNAMTKAQMQTMNGQFPQGVRPQPPVPRPNNPDQFMKHLTAFMQSRGLPLDMNPVVGDRPINIIMIYMAVNKFGGYRRVMAQSLWPQVAQALQVNSMQHPNALQQLKGHYERNLASFEEAFNAQQQQAQQAQQQRQKAYLQQNAAMGGLHPQMSPTKQMNPQNQIPPSQFLPQPQGHIQQQSLPPHGQNTPVKQVTPANSLQQPTINGFSTPQASQPASQNQQTPQTHGRNSLSRTVDATPPRNGSSFSAPSATSTGKQSSVALSPHADARTEPGKASTDFEMDQMYDPATRRLNSWGGFLPSDEVNNMLETLATHKPNVPTVLELGVIDIHALTMSLQSGIHAEVRLALDTLATLSVESRLQLDLKLCEDLVETIVDCAEVQIELLAENAAEVSDIMLITSYEDVVRGARAEREGLQDIPVFGTLEYDLDRSVERLICITTIMRNLSFYETNHALLADELVIKFLCVVIRYLGTRNTLLRSQINTLDFMKDVIIFLSNLAQTIEIPGKEQALCLMHFLLAFAPCPPPNMAGHDKVAFSPYDPAVHRYLPPAVDSLAKLLARDEPNRTYYRAIFASDVASSPPYDLLTKAFALAISPIPGRGRDEQRGYMKVVEARKPHLMQGMLAAEILSHLVPSFEASLAKSWLTSEDGFAQSLLRLVTKLSTEAPAADPSLGGSVSHRDRASDEEALLHISLSGLTVLRRLTEKSRHLDDATTAIPGHGMIKKETLLGAMLIKPLPQQPRAEIIKQLCLFAGLDN